MAFIESPRFPDKIAQGVQGGPRWDTQIIVSSSGHEQRNSRWQDARHEYDAAYGIRDGRDLEDLKIFFMTVRGSLTGFRFKDWADFRSVYNDVAPTPHDQVIGTGDGAQAAFQLVKTYDVAGLPYTREITKPVDGTVLLGVAGSPATGTIDYTTGIVTLDTPPALDAEVTAGFEFDVPCRFQSDMLATQLEVYDVGSAQVPMLEIRDIT